jgi:DNA polymerase I-like protein with 3'-5' exonuclease and polymerase domains
MEDNGFPLDVTECNLQINNLQDRVDWTDHYILPFIPPKPKQLGTTVTKVHKINGEYTKQVEQWLDSSYNSDGGVEDPTTPDVDGCFNRIEYVGINLGSSPQVNKWLLSNGWTPREWNYKKDKAGKEIKDYYGNRIKTTPKLTDESLEDLEELGQAGRLIAYRRKITHKRNQIQGFLRNVRDDGCVPSVVNTLGAATGRMTHSKIANVPAPKKGALYKEMRKVFYAPAGYLVIGADADQCQVRGLAHYMNDQGFTDTVEDPLVDLHERNGEIAGVSRSAAKNIYYGYIFGAGIPKTASQIGCSEAEATKYRDLYEQAIPMIRPLLVAITKYWRKHGYILGLDGRKIYVYSEHMLLCYLLQNYEATLVKWAMVIADKAIKDQGLDARLVTVQHDELQMIALEAHAQQVATILEDSFVEAGKVIGSRCPTKGMSKIGKTWYDTH